MRDWVNSHMAHSHMAHHRIARLIVAWALYAAMGFNAGGLTPSDALAQSCTADVQCSNGGVARAYCSGNAVVTARSVCAGSCRTVEDSRVPCAGQCLAGTCTGAPIRTPQTEPLAEPLPPRWPRCKSGCNCRNKILIITTGRWTAESGCEQQIRRCARGCSCDGPPRCR